MPPSPTPAAWCRDRWSRMGTIRRDSFPFETNDLDTTQQVSVTVAWNGSKSAIHYLWATLRNFRGQYTSIADSARAFNFAPYSRTTPMFGSSLTEGPTNAI